MIDTYEMRNKIEKEIKKTFAEVYIQNGRKPVEAFTHIFENDEKKVTTKLLSIDENGNAIVDVTTEYKLSPKFIIEGKIQ